MTNQNKMREQFEEECAEWEMDTSRDSEGDYVDRQTRRGWNLWQAATAYAGAATPKAAQGGVGGRLHQIAEPAGDELPESVIDAVAEALGDAYDCGRVWSAWSYGTMGHDDFSLVAEDAERVAEIARAAINADRAMRAQAAPVAVAVPLTKLQRKAIAVCFTSDKVSVSEVQRKLAISYSDAQTLCQSIVDLGLADELELAPSLKRGVAAPAAVAVPDGWKHDCAALLTNDVELWIDNCPHCGKPRAAAPQPPVAEQEPAAYLEKITGRICEADDVHRRKFPACYVPLYTHPAQQPSPAAQGDAKDAARYRLLRRGQHWSVINGTGDTLRADELDTAIDAARAQAKEGGE